MTTCRCLIPNTVQRDPSCWDAVSGLCGRCRRPYREVERSVVVGGFVGGVVQPDDLDPMTLERR
jgi:hypothetical protein